MTEDHPPDVIAWVDPAGRVSTRPGRALADWPEIVPYLSALGSPGLARPVSFLWVGRTPARRRVSRRVVRVSAAPETALRAKREIRLTWIPRTDALGLTDREAEVVTLLACGLGNADIATRLGIARRTVATHVESVLVRTGAATRTAAAAIAQQCGLWSLPLTGPVREEDLPALDPVVLERRARAPQPAPRRTSPKREAKPLVIGSIYPSTEQWQGDAQVMRSGAELAVHAVNDSGGIAGRPVALRAETADVTSAVSVAAAMGRLMDRNVDAITIGYAFERTREALTHQFLPATAHGCPVLHHSTSARAAALVAEEPDRFGSLFQMCTSTEHYGRGFLRTLRGAREAGTWQPRSRRLLVLESDDPDLATFDDASIQEATRDGWHPVVARLPADRGAWAGAAALVARTDPAAVLLGCYAPGLLSAFLGSHTREPTGALLYAVYAPSVPTFLHDVGEAAEGLVWATVTGLYPDQRGHRFRHEFQRRFGNPPGLSSAGIHFDMVRLLGHAWSLSHSPEDYQEVAGVLRHVVHRGVNGVYIFDDPTQTNRAYPDQTVDPSIGQAHLVHQVQDGRHVLIAPRPLVAPRLRSAAVR